MEHIEFESRQVRRQLDRRAKANGQQHFRAAAKRIAQRELLERQTTREKAGFYGRSVAAAVSPSRSRLNKRKVRKGGAFGRILKIFKEYGRERQFHATKGWRSFQAA